MTQTLLSLFIIFYGLAYSTFNASIFKNSILAEGGWVNLLPDNDTINFFFILYFSSIIWLWGWDWKNLVISDLQFSVFACTSLVATIIAHQPFDTDLPELEGLFITLTGAGLLLSATTNIFVAMIAIEMISLILYTLAPIRRDLGGVIAGGRYYLYGSFMAICAYSGILFIYSAIGSLEFTFVWESLAFSGNCQIGFFLFISYLLFKLAAFPFQFWAPSIYEYIPQTSLFVFAVVTKWTFGSFILTTLSGINSESYINTLQDIFVVLVVGNLCYGVFGGLSATKLHTLIAYSSIVHIGFMFLPLSICNTNSWFNACDTSLFYLATYVLATALFFATISFANQNITYISELQQEFSVPTYLGFLVSVISMAGLPPTIGFLAKWEVWTQINIFNSTTIITANIFLVIFSIIINVLSAWFYLKMIKLPTISNETLKPNNQTYNLVILVLVIINLFGAFLNF